MPDAFRGRVHPNDKEPPKILYRWMLRAMTWGAFFFSIDIFYLYPKNIAEDEKVVTTHIFFQHLLVLKHIERFST